MLRSAELSIGHWRRHPADGLPDWWAWRLQVAGRGQVAFEEVLLETPRQRSGLAGLYELQRTVARVHGSEGGAAAVEHAVRTSGEWIGDVGLGGVAPLLKELAPLVVTLELPPLMRDFEHLPWELGLVGGRSLAEHGVLFVRDRRRAASVTVPSSSRARGLPSHLRMLALFSLPRGSAALDLGAHRATLRGRLRDLAAGGAAPALPLEVRTRQFGVTRRTLGAMLDEPEGWDVLHIVAHGLPGLLRLEKEDGTSDELDAEDLLELLERARGRTRLVFLAVCWSAGRTANRAAVPTQRRGEAERAVPAVPESLASAIAERLGCAVVAMRFPVRNDFALRLAEGLYTHLFRQGHPLPTALHAALSDTALDARFGAGATPLSFAATPVLHGATAAGLRLPDRRLRPAARIRRRADASGTLPGRPDSFVGHLRQMTAASAALAVGGGTRGVVLHGRAGLGATTCAVQLAHDHREAFDRILWHPRPPWYGAPAPSRAEPVDSLLEQLAVEVPPLRERRTGRGEGQGGPGAVPSAPSWADLVSRMSGLRLLLVVDAADRALAHDARWGPFIDRLASAQGPLRLLLTSRTALPKRAPGLPRVELESLSDDEMRQILCSLPGLTAAGPSASRVLSRTGGNPGRLMDAERSARTSPAELEGWIRQHPPRIRRPFRKKEATVPGADI
ncbi:CHAT domain-containing protein [Streptomyces populi]|uniref:CHAT domain-containing protein n=1 Tax=Streptomyces populi TaxID=2058924 RepID=UPI0035D63784